MHWQSEMSVKIMEEQLLRLNAEAAALGTEIKEAVGDMKAATSESDRAMHWEVYNSLVAREKDRTQCGQHSRHDLQVGL